MLKGFWRLTWVETKVFVREPLGLLASLFFPLLVFFLARGVLGDSPTAASAGFGGPGAGRFPVNVPILAALVLPIGSAISLVAIITIYREGGILKRLRATPLSPLTILGAHVFVKLLFTIVGLALLVAAGRSLFPGMMDVNLFSFAAALTLSTLSIISVGFVISSVVPTARFAQPLAGALLYPMIGISGVFFPLSAMPSGWRLFANLLPVTHAAGLMSGVWEGTGWGANLGHVAGLVAVFVVCSAISSRAFRWE